TIPELSRRAKSVVPPAPPGAATGAAFAARGAGAGAAPATDCPPRPPRPPPPFPAGPRKIISTGSVPKLILLCAARPVGGILYAWPGSIFWKVFPSESIVSPFTMIQHSSPVWLCGCGIVYGAIVQSSIPFGPALQVCTQCAPILLSLSKRF